MSRNILITGSNGQLGSEIRSLAATISDNFLFTDIDELDITDPEAIDSFISDNKIDIVINCAAYTNVEGAEDDFSTAETINHHAVVYLAKSVERHGATLIHISTDYVFDGKSNIPYIESHPTSPIGVYGESKLRGEKGVIQNTSRYIIIRTSWLYSSWGNNFVKTMLRLSRERERLTVVFDQVGTPTYAADLAKGVLEIIDRGLTDQYGVYHFSNEGVSSWYDFAKAIVELSGEGCPIEPVHSSEFPSKVSRPHFSVLDKTKFKRCFKIEIPHWRESLKRCLETLNS